MMSGLWSLLASIRAPATVTPPVEVALGGGGEYETGLPEVETRSCLLEPKEILLNDVGVAVDGQDASDPEGTEVVNVETVENVRVVWSETGQ